jgi:hypothetical protein
MNPIEFCQEKYQFTSRDTVSADSPSIDLLIIYKTSEPCKKLLNNTMHDAEANVPGKF